MSDDRGAGDTDRERTAGRCSGMWVATPVPNDEIVPLLESKNITYQGIKSDEFTFRSFSASSPGLRSSSSSACRTSA